MTTKVKESGLNISGFKNALKQRSQDIGWSLCIGAGTSLGALPDWASLVEELLTKERSLKSEVGSFERLKKALSNEALIQSVRSRLYKSDQRFANTLSTALYNGFRTKVGKADWQLCARALSAISPAQLAEETEWHDFLKIVESKFPELSALRIPDTIYSAIRKDRIRSSDSIAPTAILTFNAELSYTH